MSQFGYDVDRQSQRVSTTGSVAFGLPCPGYRPRQTKHDRRGRDDLAPHRRTAMTQQWDDPTGRSGPGPYTATPDAYTATPPPGVTGMPGGTEDGGQGTTDRAKTRHARLQGRHRSRVARSPPAPRSKGHASPPRRLPRPATCSTRPANRSANRRARSNVVPPGVYARSPASWRRWPPRPTPPASAAT